MNCPKCQNFVDSENLFCPICGISLHPLLTQHIPSVSEKTDTISNFTNMVLKTTKNENFTITHISGTGEFNLLSPDGKIIYGLSTNTDGFNKMMFSLGGVGIIFVISLFTDNLIKIPMFYDFLFLLFIIFPVLAIYFISKSSLKANINIIDRFGNEIGKVDHNYATTEFTLIHESLPIVSINYKNKGSEVVFDNGFYSFQVNKEMKEHFYSNQKKSFSILHNEKRIVEFFPDPNAKNQFVANSFFIQSLEEGSNLLVLFFFCYTLIYKFYTLRSG